MGALTVALAARGEDERVCRIVVVHVFREETVRIISARHATARETRTYEEEAW